MTLLNSPAAERNKEVIWPHLSRLLKPGSHVLEIASGTGEHSIHFASQRQDIFWHPSDIDERYKASVEARRLEALQNTIYPIIHIDVIDHILSLIHI